MKRIAIVVALSSLFAAHSGAEELLNQIEDHDYLQPRSTYMDKHANDPVKIRGSAFPVQAQEDYDFLPARRTYMEKRANDLGVTGSAFPVTTSRDSAD